jgi:hypothetical protein
MTSGVNRVRLEISADKQTEPMGRNCVDGLRLRKAELLQSKDGRT